MKEIRERDKFSGTNRERESRTVTKIIKLSSKINLSEEEMKDLTTAQAELDNMYEERAKGAFVRSRRRWLEQGEKCTYCTLIVLKYFFNLEKRNYEQSSLGKLRINDAKCDNEKEISQYVVKFYKTLFSSPR